MSIGGCVEENEICSVIVIDFIDIMIKVFNTVVFDLALDYIINRWCYSCCRIVCWIAWSLTGRDRSRRCRHFICRIKLNEITWSQEWTFERKSEINHVFSSIWRRVNPLLLLESKPWCIVRSLSRWYHINWLWSFARALTVSQPKRSSHITLGEILCPCSYAWNKQYHEHIHFEIRHF